MDSEALPQGLVPGCPLAILLPKLRRQVRVRLLGACCLFPPQYPRRCVAYLSSWNPSRALTSRPKRSATSGESTSSTDAIGIHVSTVCIHARACFMSAGASASENHSAHRGGGGPIERAGKTATSQATTRKWLCRRPQVKQEGVSRLGRRRDSARVSIRCRPFWHAISVRVRTCVSITTTSLPKDNRFLNPRVSY